MSSVLVVPACEPGLGGGHLVRSAELVRSLRSIGIEAFLFLPDENSKTFLDIFLKDSDSALIADEEASESRSWDYIALDRFQTSPEEFARWSKAGALIGIDEGGSFRDRFDFLIDLLPSLPEVSPPNLLAPNLLPLPETRRESFFSPPEKGLLKILVSFGAEDPANLTIPVCRALASWEGAEVTALFGGRNRRREHIAGVKIAEHIPELREHLAEYDAVITHFGLTAFECLYARVPVVLVSPGEYHEKLAVHAGFVSAGIGEAGAERLTALLRRYTTLGEACEKIAARYALENRKTFAELLGNSLPRAPKLCPVCGAEASGGALARFPERTYRRCSVCGMTYMLRLTPPPIEYEREYFFDFYQKQYGKTYLEDFPNLIQNGKTRLKRIKPFIKHRNGIKRLLDIGCAYGPFLAAAQAEGFSPVGIDPAEDAVKYVRETLKLPCFRGFFPATPLPEVLLDASFDAVTLWYVIEHFEDCGVVFREIWRLLKPGGVLAFSTPSSAGVSGRASFAGFLEKSPADHWTIWDPRRTRALLKRYGFTLKKIVISGHHPERFPVIGTLLTRKGGFLYRLCFWISRRFRLGDTFEAYAVKDFSFCYGPKGRIFSKKK
jgi:2-polyprenyl-3-methyl-5-hydroxy-6-metoxy-1,4-benzoquinol methylase/spore coat polysaccharide biosynthesis predicted glycosyltransferase SpsG